LVIFKDLFEFLLFFHFFLILFIFFCYLSI
jgi:hypothetical protein